MGPVEWLLLGILSVLWGSSFLLIKVGLDDLPPFTLVLGRLIIAAIALNLIVIASGQRMPRSLSLWGAFIIMGALNNLIPFSLISWGQTQVASGLAGILTAMTPVFTVVLAHALTQDERLTGSKVAGVVLGIAGVATMIGVGALQGLGAHALAELAIVGGAFGYAAAGIYGRRFKGMPLLVVASGQVTASAVLMIPIATSYDQPWNLPMPSLSTWGAVVGLALFSTALAYVIYFRILGTAGPTNLQLVTFLIPVTAIMLGVVVLGETFSGQHIAGVVLIGLGLIAIDGRLVHMLRRRLGTRPLPADLGETS